MQFSSVVTRPSYLIALFPAISFLYYTSGAAQIHPFSISLFTTAMSSGAAARQRLQALSKQLVEGILDEGTFEGIPKIRHVAPDSAGP